MFGLARTISVLAAAGSAFAFANAAHATAITFQSTVTFTDSISSLHFASSGLNTTLTVGTPDPIAQFITVTVDTGAWSASNSSITANFNFTLPTPTGLTTDAGLITGGQVNGSGAGGSLAVTWPNQPIEFDFTDGTKLLVTLGNLNYTCSPEGNNCLSGQDPFYISATFLATQGPTTPPGSVGVPEPATLALFGTGAVGLGLIGWRRKRRQAAAG